MPGEGEVAILLAMRCELTHQIGVVLPGVVDQPTLTALGGQLGVLQTNPPVPGIMNRGRLRLAVLARDLTEELLAQPQEEEQPNADADPVTMMAV